jgi:hypothetical protein
MRPRSGEKTEPWLLIKSDDAFARDRGDREITDEGQHHISAAERTKSSWPQVRYAKITRPESGWRKREKLLYRASANFLALARACSQLSSSRVSQAVRKTSERPEMDP